MYLLWTPRTPPVPVEIYRDTGLNLPEWTLYCCYRPQAAQVRLDAQCFTYISWPHRLFILGKCVFFEVTTFELCGMQFPFRAKAGLFVQL